MNEIEQALKDHYQTRQLSGTRVDAILDFCAPARQVLRWKRVAFVGFGLAAAAGLMVLLMVNTAEPPRNEEIPVPGHGGVTLADLQQPERFQLIAVKIHSDPCGRCKKIAPVFADLQNQFTDDPVLFLTFDLTSEGSRRQAAFLSRIFGIEEIFEKHRNTGVIVIASPDGTVKEVVDSEAGLATATEMFQKNLSRSG